MPEISYETIQYLQLKIFLSVQNENQNNYEIVTSHSLAAEWFPVNSLFFNELKLLLALRFNNFTA